MDMHACPYGSRHALQPGKRVQPGYSHLSTLSHTHVLTNARKHTFRHAHTSTLAHTCQSRLKTKSYILIIEDGYNSLCAMTHSYTIY